jgi:GNAT superfamily N-acetyltransferase
VGGEPRAVTAGSIIYVPAGVAHHFHSIVEDLSLLVFFAPAEDACAPNRQIYSVARNGYMLSTDPSLLNLDAIHDYLSKESYWAGGRSRETIARSISKSLCFGVYDAEGQIGFARVITDYTVHAYIADVFILPAARGRGLGKWLIQCILEHPQLQDVRKWMLDTRDAHGLYEQFGFALDKAGKHMEFRRHEK